MKSLAPTSIASLVAHVEAVLLKDTHFFVAFTRGQRDPVRLLSMKLVEVRQAGLSLILEGKFEGRHGPHLFEATPETLLECGITGLTVGMGDGPNSDGIVVKYMTVRILPTFLKGAIAAELKAMFHPTTPKTRLSTLKPITETKRYKELALDISELDREIASLTKARDHGLAKLERMCAKAAEKALANTHLPPKKASRVSKAA